MTRIKCGVWSAECGVKKNKTILHSAFRIPHSAFHFYSAFTLIELIIVIVLLGILAVMALPRLMDPESKARQSATDAVAGALTAASANNYAIRKANSTKGQAVANCTDVGTLPTDVLPSGYTITSLAIANNAAVTCTVTNPDTTTTATFVGLGIS